ncbi:T9SS type B sorting domain-containing protein [Dyadobacter fanqingshengii]|uniref:Gliding motility-associated C-terminal domain-containing protein n=1 Tax=Dyadobacter fanqingshengii TaxID=2906443 RepID=A0A9X1P6W3_9BACT|nr:gliding motility-associated C-terminal domain-containing protein [Dyadobacter fanqingshengii]MCF0039984.1 gliding motility-associated C-terminal domain-containing protein [Dyadobacter fanqingshengii]USJ38262.1 gliding motility-associated C-terminal domain-containing protein [Dyadobacter fanqingshengii]
MKIRLLLLFLCAFSYLPDSFGQTVRHTYRFYKTFDVAAPECGPALTPVKALGNCPAPATDGSFVNDVLPCGVQRTIYQNNLNWGLMYPNTEGAITDNYTIQMYIKPTNWGKTWARIIDFSNGGSDQGIYFKDRNGSADRCIDFYPYGIAGACPFFNTNTYYLMTFTRNGQTGIMDVYVDNTLFASYNDADARYVGKAGTPIYIFRDDQSVSCESGQANFAYLSFTDQYYSKADVDETFNEICFTANINPNADFSIAPQAICKADQNVEIKYTGTIPLPGAGYTFEWDFDGAEVISGTGMGPYVLKWNTTGEKDVALTIVNIKCGNKIVNIKQATVSDLSLTTTLEPGTCDKTSEGTLTVTGKGGSTPYQYSIDSVNYQADASFKLFPADYRVFMKDSDGCVVKEPVKVEFSSNITVQTIADTVICAGGSVQLTTTSNAQNFAWEAQASLDNPTAKDPVASPLTTTQYIVNASLGVCNLRDTVTIQVAPAIEVKATRDALIDINVPFQLVASSPQVMNLNDATFTWSPPTGLNNPSSPSPIATLQADQSYTIAVTSGMGCTGKAIVNLRVRRRENLTVPTAFTPNGDGKNEILMPVINDITSLNFFKIYDRWGELVFYTKELNKGWDGTFDGKPAVSGTYVWMIEGISNEGKVMRKNGSAMLIK